MTSPATLASAPDLETGTGTDGGRETGGATGADPTARDVWRSARGPVLVALGLVLLGVLAGLAGGRPAAGALDPRAADPAGSLAVAELLRTRGVAVDRLTRTADALADAGPGTTLVLPYPTRVPAGDLRALARSGADVVAVAPDEAAVAALQPGVEVAGNVPAGPRQPACGLPAARTAGDADTGGSAYTVTGDDVGGRAVTRCYAAGGDATLLHVAASAVLADRGSVALLGSGAALQNASLDERGNAALALGLLGGQDRVLWLLPPPGAAVGPEDRGGLLGVLPDGVRLAVLQVALAAGVLMYARGRRLGRVVPERLPVVVRAAETVEGLGRLYRAAGARDRAAEALRASARARLGPGLGVPADAGPQALVAAVGLRTGRPPDDLGALLYGPVPADDAALVGLAGELDALTATALRDRTDGRRTDAAAPDAPAADAPARGAPAPDAPGTDPRPSPGGPTA